MLSVRHLIADVVLVGDGRINRRSVPLVQNCGRLPAYNVRFDPLFSASERRFRLTDTVALLDNRTLDRYGFAARAAAAFI